MFCPGCGSKNSTEQKFCRSCGMNLTDIAASFLQQLPHEGAANIRKQERMLERFGQIAFGGFGVVLLTAVGGIIYWIVTKTILTGESFWGGILLIAFIVFAVLTLAYVILRESINEKKQKLNPQLTVAEIESGPAAAQLDQGNFQPVISVIEDTTDLLPVERGTRKLQ
jgi:hypothetical protein